MEEPKGALRVTKKQTDLRKKFSKAFKKGELKQLVFKKEGGQAELLQRMRLFKKKYKEEEGLQTFNLENGLNMVHSQNGRKQIVNFFENILETGLPDEPTYKKQLNKIKKEIDDPSIKENNAINGYASIRTFLDPPVPQSQQEIELDSSGGSKKLPAKSPSMSEEDLRLSDKMIKDDKREKMMSMSSSGAGAGVVNEPETNPNANPSSTSSSTSSQPKPEMEEPKPEMKEEMKDEGTHTMPDGSKMSGKTHSKDSKPISMLEEPFVLPTKMDSIPPSRLSSSFKDVEDLNDDIKYFLKNFGNLLKPEKAIYKKISKNDKPNLIKLHSRIVGKLSPKIPTESDRRGKKVGIVLDAQEYIRSEMKRLMENNTFSNMSPSDVVIDLGYNDKINNPDVKDFGDFEVKRNSEGGLSSRREGIYRYAPTEGNDEVGLEDVPERKKRKPRRLANIPLKEINEAKTAQRMVRKNPFARNVKTIKLKYLY